MFQSASWNCHNPKEAQGKTSSDIALDVAWWVAGQAKLSVRDAIDAGVWADWRAASLARQRGPMPNVTFGPAQGAQPDASMPESLG